MDQGLLGEGSDAQRRREFHTVEGHLLRGVVGGEAVPGATPEAGSTLPADGPPVQDHEVTGRHVRDPFPDLLDYARGRVAQQERKFVVDGALAVVEVRAADPTCLDGHEDLTRARVRDLDGLDGDRLTLGSGDYGPDAVRHDSPLGSTGRPEVDPTTAGR